MSLPDPKRTAEPRPQVPWFQSPFFEAAIADQASTEAIEQARTFRDTGILVLEDFFDDDTLDRVIRETEPLYVDDVPDGPRSRIRLQDVWDECETVRQLAGDERVLGLLRRLYRREPFPFQTLNFRYGTEQASHQDRMFFNSLPRDFMCGVWVALEDVSRDNGGVYYYPGSHRLQDFSYDDLALGFANNTSPRIFDHGASRVAYEGFLEQLAEAAGLERVTFTAKRGTVLIWAAGILHGGGSILKPGSTRWSQVTHYFFKDCLYTTPIYNNDYIGDLYLRPVIDVRTGETVLPRYYGLDVPSLEENGLYKLVLDWNGQEEILETADARVFVVMREERAKLQQAEQRIDELRVSVDRLQELIQAVERSPSFRLGRALTGPLRWLRHLTHSG